MHACHGRYDEARHALNRSLELGPSAWALWFSGQIDAAEGTSPQAALAYRAAHERAPHLARLAIACSRAWLRADHPQRALDALVALAPSMRDTGEMAVIEGDAALMLGDLDRAMSILATPITIANLREGDTSLTSLWFCLHAHKLTSDGQPLDPDLLQRRLLEEYPPPRHIDYRASWHDVRF